MCPGSAGQSVYIYEVVPLDQGYETARPPELSRPPRRADDPNVKDWLNFAKKQAKSYFGQFN